MKFDNLFEERNLVAAKLKEYLRTCGYTKVSFAKMTNISRPTLDKLLNGDIDNKNSFDKHMQKILATLNISVDELLLYTASPHSVDAVYSQNAPDDYSMNSKAKKQYELLMDLLGLCEIYY